MNRYYDNTMLSDYKKCPRYYYLRHLKHWRSQGISAALTFGLAWHDAMDILWQGYGKVPDNELLGAAAYAFDMRWEEQGMPSVETMTLEDHERLAPRTPMIAREMLANYLEARRPLMDASDLLFAEQPFAVPLYPDRPDLWYIGRMDKGISNRGTRIILEHKTTTEYKKDGGFKTQYLESWFPNAQAEGYLYSANMVGEGSFRYVWIDAALVHKKEHHFFKFIPIAASFANLDAWLWEARDWISRIMSEEDRLADCDPESPIMTAFPRHTNECIGKYGKCQFLDVCRGVPNPLKQAEPLGGYIVEKWEPFNILGIEKLGLKKETENVE